MFYEDKDNAHMFKNQQFMLEQAMHACDISQGCRSFKVVHEWTYLLFDEFFD